MVFPAKRFDLSINKLSRVAGFQGLCLQTLTSKPPRAHPPSNNSTSIPSSAAATSRIICLFQSGFCVMQAGGINQNYLRIFPCHNALDPVPRRLGLRRNNRNLLSHQAIHQCRLSRVRPSHNRGESRFVCRSRLFCTSGHGWIACWFACNAAPDSFCIFTRKHFPLVGLQHFKTKPFQIKFLAGRWNLSAHMAQKSRQLS